jgi:type II secretory pathway pseudopilin PulG
MTLIEVMIAITILAAVMLSLGSFTTAFSRTVTQSNVRSTASDLAVSRMETVKSSGRYDQIETLFQGTESTLQGYPGYSRETQILHIGGSPSDSVDYKVITVVVSAPRLSTPVRKSTVISSF